MPFMYDKELIVELLSKMIEATEKVLYRSKNISSVDDFLENDESLMLLDSLCMQFIALGEAVKKIDKLTDKKLLTKYPNIPWKDIAGMRDILSHHYFDLNADVIYDVTTEYIPNLRDVLKEILIEIE
jgi:uncharacterized protein with HEPN domain